MNSKSLVLGACTLFFLGACEEVALIPEKKEPETVLHFESKAVDMFIDCKSKIVLSVEPIDKSASVEIISTDGSVVGIVDKTIEDGIVTLTLEGLNLGTSTIAAALDDKYEECAVRVLPVPVESLVLDATTLDLDVYKSYTFSVSILPANATAPKVEWSSSDETVAVVNHGTVIALSEGTAVITASVADIKAECTVNVHIIKGESLTLDISSAEIYEDETFITTATVLPEDVTVKGMRWTVTSGEGVIGFEVIDPKEDDNETSAKVIGLKAGEAVLSVECAGLKADCRVTVKEKEIPVQDAKVGDYYYSDGTWSDGGFLGYAEDGVSAIWADTKPSPLEGKTVIGIVFQTDQGRISDTEKALGYTHGLVMAIRSAHSPSDSLTRYSFDYDFDGIPNKKLAPSWYKDIEGYRWTQAILAAYPGTELQQCPAFDWTTTDFKPSAPEGTSGWYVPSIGQVWDLLSAFGGSQLAEQLKELREYGSDITYHSGLTLPDDPIRSLNSVMSEVPAEMKEDFKTSNVRNGSKLCELMSSSLYDNSDGAVCVFWLYDTGRVDPVCDWTDQTYICRPVLSF